MTKMVGIATFVFNDFFFEFSIFNNAPQRKRSLVRVQYCKMIPFFFWSGPLLCMRTVLNQVVAPHFFFFFFFSFLTERAGEGAMDVLLYLKETISYACAASWSILLFVCWLVCLFCFLFVFSVLSSYFEMPHRASWFCYFEVILVVFRACFSL